MIFGEKEKMKSKKQFSGTFVIISLILVAVVFSAIGILIGKSFPPQTASSGNSIFDNGVFAKDSSYEDAYMKGWVCWFNGYGMNGVNAAYMDQYIYGRQYGNAFSSEREAFEAGYKDGFYHVNNCDPGDDWNERIERGYNEFFGNPSNEATQQSTDDPLELKREANNYAYMHGWQYYCSSVSNISNWDKETCGRNYGKDFSTEKEAFIAGFKDAFFYENNYEIGDEQNSLIEEGYSIYYG